MSEKKSIRKPIILKILLAIALILLLNSSVLFFVSSLQSKKNYVHHKKQEMKAVIAGLKETLKFLVAEGEIKHIQKAMAPLRMNASINDALILDGRNIVIASAHLESIGKNVNGLLSDRVRKRIKIDSYSLKENLNNNIWLSSDGKSLYAISAVTLDRLVDETRYTDDTGIIFLNYDMDRIDGEVYADFIKAFWPAIIFLGVTCLGIIIYFHISITRRLKKINKVADQFASGNYGARIKIIDNDEISSLGQAFNLMAQDVQEKHEELLDREQSLVNAQQMAKMGGWRLDLVSDELIWSDEIYRIFEIDKDKFGATYESYLNVIHSDDLEKVNTAYINSIKDKTLYSIDHRLRMTDGRIKHIRQNCKTFYDESGNPMYSLGTVQDVTEQIRLEQIMQRSEKMEALGKLTGGIVHDYRNMLGIIMGYSNELESRLVDQPELVDFIHEIKQASSRGADLADKLLSFSRKNSTEAKAININKLIAERRRMLEKTFTSTIQLVMDLSEDIWLMRVDSNDLLDAIVNLSINAMHAMDGHGTLTITTCNKRLNEIDASQLELEPGDYVLLSIEDTGCGLNEFTKSRMFDPFYSTKGEKGSGLGLSQVYGFVKRSGGTIIVESELDEGTQFMIYFPRCKESENNKMLTEETKITDTSGNETILIVDDEPALLDIASRIFEPQGYRVICANSGEQALDILKSESIDLLLSDVVMPEMDGYQLVNVVQDEYPSVKIQLVSGYSDEHHDELSNEILHQNLIQKPLDPQVLLQRIRLLLDSH